MHLNRAIVGQTGSGPPTAPAFKTHTCRQFGDDTLNSALTRKAFPGAPRSRECLQGYNLPILTLLGCPACHPRERPPAPRTTGMVRGRGPRP